MLVSDLKLKLFIANISKIYFENSKVKLRNLKLVKVSLHLFLHSEI